MDIHIRRTHIHIHTHEVIMKTNYIHKIIK